MAEPNYDINYDDKRFTQVETDKEAALSDVEKTYGGMIDESESFYKAQIDASKDWAETQKKNQQAQTDFAIEKINQQKDQTKKDYTKEQSGAYADWQKQSNAYGAEAEQRAAAGLTGTGFSESTQTAKYVAYQNRVAAARESYNRAVLNYDNAIKDATLQNNSALAEIAYKALQEQLTLSLQGFQYKNSLLIEKANKKQETENIYYNKWRDVLTQINQENALAENVRQYNESLALEREKFDWQKEQATKSASISGGGGGGSSSGGGNSSGGGAQIEKTNSYAVSTDYYQGDKNPDADKYGTFSNGYQPKGISGHGKLKKSGEQMSLTTTAKYGANAGKTVTLVQTVWKAEDGTLWYWEGRDNQYIQIK